MYLLSTKKVWALKMCMSNYIYLIDFERYLSVSRKWEKVAYVGKSGSSL